VSLCANQAVLSVDREDNSLVVGLVPQARRSQAREVVRGMGCGLIGRVRMQAWGWETIEMGGEGGGAVTMGCKEMGSSASVGRSLSSTTSMWYVAQIRHEMSNAKWAWLSGLEPLR
jgi:hypothetical protein